ncbi:MAG: hypothetical protein AB7D57_11245 [Desulfovibrionaceae bacterium]
MKIHPDQIEGIRQTQPSERTSRSDAAAGFEDILGQEVSRTGEEAQSGLSAGTVGSAATPRVNPLWALNQVSEVGADDAATPEEQVQAVLDGFDAYADDLRAPDGSGLKDAYAELEDIEATVADLKQSVPADSNLGGLVNELDVLAATEKFKFNRGDYL